MDHGYDVPGAKTSNGKMTKLYHFDSKTLNLDHFHEVGIPFVGINAVGDMNNLTIFVRPQAIRDGSYALNGTWTATTKMPLVDTLQDLGLSQSMARFLVKSLVRELFTIKSPTRKAG